MLNAPSYVLLVCTAAMPNASGGAVCYDTRTFAGTHTYAAWHKVDPLPLQVGVPLFLFLITCLCKAWCDILRLCTEPGLYSCWCYAASAILATCRIMDPNRRRCRIFDHELWHSCSMCRSMSLQVLKLTVLALADQLP
jgi:hypothetical protein